MQTRCLGTAFLWATLSLCVGVPAAASPQQKLPDPFAGELAGIRREGLELQDYRHADSDGPLSYLVTLLENDPRRSPAGRVSQMRIYRSDSRKTLVLAREEFEGMALEFHELDNTDINGDGFSEIVIRKGCSGTAWSCRQIGVYQLRGDRLIHLSGTITGKLFPGALVDVDQDGVMEIIATQTRWETYEYLPHPVAPSVEEVFAWRGGGYRRASREFTGFYGQKIGQIESLMDQLNSPYDYLGNAVRLLLNYDRMGQAGRGWEEFERLLQTERPSIVKNDVWTSIKEPIREDFKKAIGKLD